MKAKTFFEEETIESNFEKLPEGDTFINKETLDIETTEKDFGNGKKTRYELKFKNKEKEEKEYEVGVSIVRGIEKELLKPETYIRVTRSGTTKENTHYTVTSTE